MTRASCRLALALALAVPFGAGLANGAEPGAPSPPAAATTSTTPAATPAAPPIRTVPVAPAAAETRGETRSGLREPAPRPVADARIQNRYARNAQTFQLFAGVDYLERRDFYVSPGVRIGGTYYLLESLGLELQVSHYFSRLNQAGVAVEQMLGVVPDSRAPTWLLVAGGRYSFGYGKMMIASFKRVIHFEPQALVQGGIHVHDGSFGPSGLAGVGLMVHATPRWFFRLEGGVTVELERRVTGDVTVVGFLPSLVTGGVF